MAIKCSKTHQFVAIEVQRADF